MNRKPLRWSRGFTLSLFVAVTLACGVRQDEFDCENAVAHLRQCCPGFNPSAVQCNYIPAQGCDDTTTYPEYDIVESDCIRAESCSALIATGVCDRATRRSGQPYAGTSTHSPGAVCPGGGSLPAPSGSKEPPPNPSNPEVACTSSTTCAGGLVCCAVLANPYTQCQPWPCASGIQICATEAECNPGETCSRISSSIALNACGIPDGGAAEGSTADDAGDGPAPDAERDAPADADARGVAADAPGDAPAPDAGMARDAAAD
jgi:hypothetical protein